MIKPATDRKTKNIGKITQIIGPVMDVVFSPGQMPNIYNALVINGRNEAGQELSVTCEVQQLLGDNKVRAIATVYAVNVPCVRMC